MTRKTSILALVSAGALTGFGTAAAAQSGGSVTCEEYLLMDERTQGRIALEIVETPEGIATTTDIPGDVAVGTVEGLVTACEVNPERTTAEIAAEIFDDKDGDGRPEMPSSENGGIAGSAAGGSFEQGNGDPAAPAGEDMSGGEAVGDAPEADATSDDSTGADAGGMEAGEGGADDGSATEGGAATGGSTGGDADGSDESGSDSGDGSDGSGSDGGSDGSGGGGSDGGDGGGDES